MKKNKIVITAIVGIVILESIALLKDINGTLLTIVVAAIAGLAGWSAPTPKILKN